MLSSFGVDSVAVHGDGFGGNATAPLPRNVWSLCVGCAWLPLPRMPWHAIACGPFPWADRRSFSATHLATVVVIRGRGLCSSSEAMATSCVDVRGSPLGGPCGHWLIVVDFPMGSQFVAGSMSPRLNRQEDKHGAGSPAPCFRLSRCQSVSVVDETTHWRMRASTSSRRASISSRLLVLSRLRRTSGSVLEQRTLNHQVGYSTLTPSSSKTWPSA